MKDWYVFFDMDGVLADFDKGIRELCNISPHKQDEADPEADKKMWDAVKGVEHFYDLLEK